MKYECKICKKNLTNQAILLLENKIQKVKCTCFESEAKDLQKKIAKEFSLSVSDNSSKLVSDYEEKEFDKWLEELVKKNGTTKY